MYYYKSPSCPFDIPQKINQGILLDDCHYKYINLITIDTLFVRLDIYRKSNMTLKQTIQLSNMIHLYTKINEHPNIVKLYAVVENQENIILFYEYPLCSLNDWNNINIFSDDYVKQKIIKPILDTFDFLLKNK